jgi:hypothetical protein
MHDEMRNAYKILVGKPERKRSLRRRKHKRKVHIKMHLRETGCEGVGWTHLALDRAQWRDLVNTIMNIRSPYKARNFVTS